MKIILVGIYSTLEKHRGRQPFPNRGPKVNLEESRLAKFIFPSKFISFFAFMTLSADLVLFCREFTIRILKVMNVVLE